MYWIESKTNHSRINKASMDGQGKVTIADSNNKFSGLALDLAQEMFYWSKSNDIGYIHSNGSNGSLLTEQESSLIRDNFITSVMIYNGSLFYARSRGEYGKVLSNGTLGQSYSTYICLIGLYQSKVVTIHQQTIDGKEVYICS